MQAVGDAPDWDPCSTGWEKLTPACTLVSVCKRRCWCQWRASDATSAVQVLRLSSNLAQPPLKLTQAQQRVRLASGHAHCMHGRQTTSRLLQAATLEQWDLVMGSFARATQSLLQGALRNPAGPQAGTFGCSATPARACCTSPANKGGVAACFVEHFSSSGRVQGICGD